MPNVRTRCAKEAPMDYKITGYEPAKLFHYFEEISAIPVSYTHLTLPTNSRV